MRKSIFISYSHSDSAQFAVMVRDRLVMAGHKAFFDTESIVPGSNWEESISNAIINADYFLLVLSLKSIASGECRKEWNIALQYQKPVIPLYYMAVSIPEELSKIQYIDFTDELLFDSKFQRLRYTIEGADITIPSVVSWQAAPIKNFAIHYSRQHVYCITEKTSLANAYDLMFQSDFVFRHLIVTANGKAGSPLHGILSLRHILKHFRRKSDLSKLSADEVMDRYNRNSESNHYFVVIHEDDSLRTALDKFNVKLTRGPATESYFYMSAIPLIDKEGNATGIVSFKDVLRALDNIVPIPDRTVGEVMSNLNHISYSLPDESFEEANLGLAQYGPGQRDVPIVDNRKDLHLIGLIPDHIFITNFNSKRPVGEFMTEYSKLRVQFIDTPLKETLSQYLSGDVSAIFYSFPVVMSEETQQLAGLIGYRDIFRALLHL